MKFLFIKPGFFCIAGLIISQSISAQRDTLSLDTQFLLPELIPAKISFKDGSDVNARMNYNILSEKMIFMKDNKVFDLVNTEKIDTVFLQGRKFVPMDKIFVEVYSGSAIPLFTQFRGDLIPPGKPSGYGGTSQTSSIESIATIYGGAQSYNLKLPSDYTVRLTVINWIRINGKMEKFISERQFLKLYKSKETEIRKFIKTNNTDFNNRNDIVKLLAFCNSI
jgi:hypothetical protein